MSAAATLPAVAVGAIVEMRPDSPLECEGVAPLPGDVGQVVAEPDPDDGGRRWRVRFSRVGCEWLIPERFLRRVRLH